MKTTPPPRIRKPSVPCTRFPARAVPLALALALLLLLPARAAAHAHLESARPGQGDTIQVPPTELRLTFSEGVELAVSEIHLQGPLGEVVLAPLASADGGTVLVAAIRGSLLPGRYTVHWHIVSDDGHPSSGYYSFVVAGSAQGLAPPAAAATGPAATGRAPRPDAQHASAPAAGEPFGVQSPLYAAVRFLAYLGLLLTIGAAAFRMLVLWRVRRASDAVMEGFVGAAAARAAAWGLGAAVLLLVALVLRLYAQSAAVHGSARALDAAWVETLLTHTLWGWAWLLQAAGVLLALMGFALARRHSAAGWAFAFAGVLTLAVAEALSGHAAGAGSWAIIAVTADALHVLGAGGWLGTLLLVVVVGVPLARNLDVGQCGRAVAFLIHAFSPTALVFAGLVAVTGLFAAWLHLSAVADLWTTPYGRTLLLKLALLVGVFAAGTYNWLRVKPSLGAEEAAVHLRRSATAEIAIGVLVLAVTAVLVATPPPAAAQPPTHALARRATPADSAAVAAAVARFHHALATGDSAAALRLLAPGAVILESGGVETRAEYRAHHLAADVAFARQVETERGPVRVRVKGNTAWATSLSTTSGAYEQHPIRSQGAELMVLSRLRDGWVVEAVHWSSRRRSP